MSTTEATAFGVIPATTYGPVGLIVSVVLGALFVGFSNVFRACARITLSASERLARSTRTIERTQRVGGISFMVLGVLLIVAGVVSSVVFVGDMLMVAIIVTIAVGAAPFLMYTATCCSAAVAVRGKTEATS